MQNPLKTRWFALLEGLTEVARGYQRFRTAGPTVAVFGSARFGQSSPYAEMAQKLGAELASRGFAVMTGGGPGIMEAANRGAREAGGLSLGCGIELPYERQHNSYLDRSLDFEHFFARKVTMIGCSCAFVVLPGGVGTLDELFEIMTLIRTGKLPPCPVVIMGKDYWQPLLDWMHTVLLPQGALDASDLELLRVTDDAVEAAEMVQAGVRATERARIS